MQIKTALLTAVAIAAAIPSFAQPQPPLMRPADLDHLVAPIALYPDPLLAQVLAGATYSDQLPDAQRWADEHHYLTGDALASAIQNDQLPWDPSVQALLPFPSVLDTMTRDINWTNQLGDAFLDQQQDVMDAVQRMRRQAMDYGYLRTGGQVVVSGGPYISIAPVNPGLIYVPYYDPAVVFIAPRPGFAVRGAIRFNFGITIGAAFRPWGWGSNRFDWGSHVVIVNNAPWRRTWSNRATYVHPYEVRRVAPAPRPAERHVVEQRSPQEKSAYSRGEKRVEQHKAPPQDRGKGRDDKGGRDDRR
ncbi:MAG TPA: DUF3300 domain-containing protein [Bryobacteraceae bacterium]